MKLTDILREIEDEEGGDQKQLRVKYDLAIDPESLDDALKALDNIENYGIYAQNMRDPKAIANRIYANRMGNGDESSGHGFAFRGRGLIQLTGKSNYQSFADSLEIDVNEATEYLETFEGAAQSACWFWETNKLNQWADTGDILTLTKRINGGTIGLNDRIKHYKHALSIMQVNGKLIFILSLIK